MALTSFLRYLPAAAARRIARAWPVPADDEIAEITGLNEAQWDEMATLFPLLGTHAGRNAAIQRRCFGLLSWNALVRSSRRVDWRPAPPDPDPALYLTIHLGNLRLLRYLLRFAGISAATIVDETHRGNARGEAENAWVDRRSGLTFPHALFSGAPHRLRSALRRGSLIAAIDRIHAPAPGRTRPATIAPFLGGRLELDLSALRLAKIARVPARPIFVTLPRQRLTITIGAPLPDDLSRAGERFGALADAVARDSPADFDAYTHRFLPRDPDGGGFRGSFLR